LFDELDYPAALPLPQEPYEYAEWKQVRVNLDYHVEVDRHYYSVPFSLLREKLDARLTTATVELFFKNQRVAAHIRSDHPHRHTTVKEHMPPEHRKHAEWSPTRIIDWAGKTGPATAQVAAKILESRTFPEQAYRSCLGLLRLGQTFSAARLEAASLRALQFHTYSYKAVRAILEKGLDRQTPTVKDSQQTLPFHGNVRGGEYFH
jgi:transposase